MTTGPTEFETRRTILWMCALSLTILGCSEADQIHSYNVPKEAPRVAATADTSEPTDRMLAAILPAGDTAWFFKLVGPLAAVDKNADAINEFFAGIRPPTGDDRPSWNLPEGWTEQAGAGMRAATIVVPNDGAPLEITVTRLPWTGTQADMLGNVNRWRGQIGLPPVDGAGLATSTREIKAGDATMTLVDLHGRMKATGMTPPFASGGPFSGAPSTVGANARRPKTLDLPSGHPLVDSASTPQAAPQTTEPAAEPSHFHFTAPASWQTLPAGGMRKAAFQVADGNPPTLVTVTNFPVDAGPMMANPLANVNRWRGEVGLDAVDAAQLSSVTKSVEIGGKPATFVDAIPDRKQPQFSHATEGTLAAIIKDGDRIWFVKLKGDIDVVTAQRDNFQSFLKSIQFAAAGGAPHGN